MRRRTAAKNEAASADPGAELHSDRSGFVRLRGTAWIYEYARSNPAGPSPNIPALTRRRRGCGLRDQPGHPSLSEAQIFMVES